MMRVSRDINALTRDRDSIPGFPDAPLDWTPEEATQLANEAHLTLTDAHCEAIRALQHYFLQHEEDGHLNLRDLHDALDEHFHHMGGLKYLYQLFPGGPVAQGCHLAGLKAPFLASDKSFGSVA